MMAIKKILLGLILILFSIPPVFPVTLQWDANSESDLAGYNIYRSQTDGSGYTKVNQNLITSTAYTDSTPTYLQTYYYVATAVNTGGLESGYSNQVQYNYVCRGDANLDQSISVSDAVAVASYIVGSTQLIGEALLAADANNDGQVTVSDVVAIQLSIVGLGSLRCP